MANPKISVIIVYKNNKNLYECVQSLVQQSFSNIEVICVNNGAKDNAEEVVKKQAEKINRIKLISLPNGVEDEIAKRAGLSIALGDFIIFIENNEVVEADFIKNIYVELLEENKIKLKDKYLYRRSFLENDREISGLIDEKIKSELNLYSNFVDEQTKKIDDEFDKFNKNNVENIKNSAFELMTRFNVLEKQFYDKDWHYQERIKNIEDTKNQALDDKINNVYSDITKVYDYINSEINKKGCEINNVYDEISKNYKFTEELVQNKLTEVQKPIEIDNGEIYKKINELEKEIIFRYVNLKRIMDIQLDEIKNRLNGG